ncbi:type B 50S ribosomal protein L31 [Tautonia sociabilis]|uniref:Large ribosomal subunit protein bL31B n=1 Tax=Tautonia sociabilis TaxID=2080755 RepID=A0A432MFQ7_9BACT|nr:type B 50S ribosomal protein L31 [Tautonia sociabilis]RUL84996.1 type B 50S ribosomal protein L31 [Tautonia sociabilis]
MKEGIHPNYRPVLFQDASSGFEMITRSTIKTNQKITRDGVEYPLVVVDVSSHSHPFYTGKTKFVDAAGRVDKFNRKFQGRYGKKKQGEGAEG